MEVYCGNYMDYKPKRRIHWLRLFVLLLLVSGASAATPAVISYYWDGRNSENLQIEEAVRLVNDDSMPKAKRRSAALEVYLLAKDLIGVLKDAQTDAGKLGSDAKLALTKLSTHIGR